MLRFALHGCSIGLICVALANIGGCPAQNNGDVMGENVDDAGGGEVVGNPNDAPGDEPIQVDPTDTPPTVSVVVSPPSGIVPGAVVTLDASSAADPDGDALSFEWSQLEGDVVAINNPSEAATTLVAPLVVNTARLVFRVVVRDGRGGEASADAVVLVEVADQFAGSAQSSAPYRESLTTDEAYHLLRRIQCGAAPIEVQRAVESGLNATVSDYLMIRPHNSATLDLEESYEDNIPKRWLVHMIDGVNPLAERLAFFWHDRFATSRRVLTDRDRGLAKGHWNMLRDNSLGNYRTFLQQLTLDPLMLIWLDGANSPKAHPNENYAREFWELFTLGRDTLYTEADIRESARAFTGITLLRQNDLDARPIFDLINHDNTPKVIFPGRAPAASNYDYISVIDLTLSQPEAPRYVARNLFKFFVHDHPNDTVVQELADFFVQNNFEIAPLVKKILMSQAMFSAEARHSQISSPVEHYVGVARTLEMHIFSEDSQGYIFDRVSDYLNGAGQELLNPPGVEGWNEQDAWLQDQWVISRAKALRETMDYGRDLKPEIPWHLLPAQSTWNDRSVSRAIVNAVASAFHLTLSEAEQDIYLDVLDQGGSSGFHQTNPDNQPDQVAEMIRLMAMDERVFVR